jgi:peroxiredoxin Q/BCP
MTTLALVIPLLAAAGESARPAPGTAAPAFSLPASNGKTVSLADFKGERSVVLAFFPKAFTGG